MKVRNKYKCESCGESFFWSDKSYSYASMKEIDDLSDEIKRFCGIGCANDYVQKLEAAS